MKKQLLTENEIKIVKHLVDMKIKSIQNEMSRGSFFIESYVDLQRKLNALLVIKEKL